MLNNQHYNSFKTILLIVISNFVVVFSTNAQVLHKNEIDSLENLINAGNNLSDKALGKIDHYYNDLNGRIDKATLKYLNKLQKAEAKLLKKLYKLDSSALKTVETSTSFYNKLKENSTDKLKNYEQLYNGKLDSLTTGLGFLNKEGLLKNITDIKGKLPNINETQLQLNRLAFIEKELEARKAQLKNLVQNNTSLHKYLGKYNKEMFYAKKQIEDFKQIAEQPEKAVDKLIELAMKFPKFQQFFAKYSMLGQIFNLPSNEDYTVSSGLQTRASVMNILESTIGTSVNVTEYLNQQMGTAQNELQALQQKAIDKINSYGSNEDIMPKHFKPNNQRNKKFKDRLVYNFNMQSQKSNNLIPISSDIALGTGYKISDKSIVGVAAGYKMGWGTGWRNIQLSTQGISLRTYIEYNIKKSFWLTGGYEQNYLNQVRNQARIYNINRSGWQQSGLIGVSKQVSLQSKFFKSTKAQLLWDFLSYQQIPRPSAIVFRVGYGF
jgi:hypothetical protein